MDEDCVTEDKAGGVDEKVCFNFLTVDPMTFLKRVVTMIWRLKCEMYEY